jgi:hypothetical protein
MATANEWVRPAIWDSPDFPAAVEWFLDFLQASVDSEAVALAEQARLPEPPYKDMDEVFYGVANLQLIVDDELCTILREEFGIFRNSLIYDRLREAHPERPASQGSGSRAISL